MVPPLPNTTHTHTTDTRQRSILSQAWTINPFGSCPCTLHPQCTFCFLLLWAKNKSIWLWYTPLVDRALWREKWQILGPIQAKLTSFFFLHFFCFVCPFNIFPIPQIFPIFPLQGNSAQTCVLTQNSSSALVCGPPPIHSIHKRLRNDFWQTPFRLNSLTTGTLYRVPSYSFNVFSNNKKVLRPDLG